MTETIFNEKKKKEREKKQKRLLYPESNSRPQMSQVTS